MPATLGARVRLLGSGRTSKTDRNVAFSVAVAAIRHPRLRAVEVEDHMAQIRVLVDRQMHLSASRIKAASRLHALLREVLPGGARRGLRAHMARTILEELDVDHPADETRREVALEIVADIERIEDQMNTARARLAREVNASNTTLPEILGCGPITAAMILSRVRNVNRFASRDHFADRSDRSVIR